MTEMKFNGIGDEALRFVAKAPSYEDGQLESMAARIMALESLVAAMADEIARLQPNLLDGVMAKAKYYKTEICDE